MLKNYKREFVKWKDQNNILKWSFSMERLHQ